MESMIRLLVIATTLTTVIGNLQQQVYYAVPKNVVVTMNVNINPSSQFSYMQVYGPSGDEVSRGDCAYLSKKVMSIPIKEDGAGTYVVFWHILSDDMLEHQGVKTFVVNEINVPLLLLDIFFAACILSAIFLFTRRFTHAYHRK